MTMRSRQASAPRTITSLTNDQIKAIRALEMRKERKETGLFVAEGTSILLTAREFGVWPRTLVYLAASADTGVQKGLVEGALVRGAQCLEVSRAILEKLSGKDNPQTMLGVFDQVWLELPDASKASPEDTWIALEEIRDPGNLGTIIRTADAFGAKGVILIGSCADPFSREAIRATMGSIFAVPLVRTDATSFADLAKRWRGDVVGTHLAATEDVRSTRHTGPVMIVMGGEGPGLSPSLTQACNRLVKIPMAGRLDSLNLAVATAITVFEVRRPHLKL